MVENWCGCGRIWEDEKRKPYCPDCIGLMRQAKRLESADKYRLRRTRAQGRRTKRLRILERDNWICQICLLPIPKKAKMGEVLYGNVDHIVPTSKGGLNEDFNMQATHEVCNSVKAAKEDESFKEAMREILQEIVRSVKS